MIPEEIREIERVLNLVPPCPWVYHEEDDLDHWMLWSDDPLHGYVMVDEDAGVPPDPGFIEYILKSREIIEKLLKELKKT